MVYVDELFIGVETDAQARRVGKRNGHKWCHMWADTIGELHEMGRKIGLRRSWFQDRADFPHYDLVPRKRALALQLGAQVKSLREALREMRADQRRYFRVPAKDKRLSKGDDFLADAWRDTLTGEIHYSVVGYDLNENARVSA